MASPHLGRDDSRPSVRDAEGEVDRLRDGEQLAGLDGVDPVQLVDDLLANGDDRAEALDTSALGDGSANAKSGLHARERDPVAVGGVARYWDESTLVQRRTIWDLVGEYISDDPFLGQGWEAFWHTPALHTDELLTRGSAHSTIVELLLGVGVLGLLLWLIVAGTAVIGVGVRLWRDPDVEAWLWAAVVTFLLVENLTESFVLWFSYNWVLLTAAALRFGIGWRRPRAVRSESPSAAVNA